MVSYLRNGKCHVWDVSRQPHYLRACLPMVDYGIFENDKAMWPIRSR